MRTLFRPLRCFVLYLIKTNANGDSLWAKTYGGTGDDAGYSVEQTLDDGYIISGRTNSSDVYLVKTNANGDSLWAKTFDLGIRLY